MKKNYNQPQTEIISVAPVNMIMSGSTGIQISGTPGDGITSE